jgi:hypothetical protein
MDFFFSRYIKDIAHSGKLEAPPVLYRRITAAVAAKWNFVSTSVGPSVVLALNFTKLY